MISWFSKFAFSNGKLVYCYALVVLLPDMTYNQRWCAVFIPAMGSFLVGDILGPTVYRKGLDLNEVVILLALVFWFSVWGGVGAVLAVPIMCTVKIIMGKGFGFVTFDKTAQAMAAVRAMNGLKCGAKCLKVRGRRRRRRRHGRRRFLSSPRHCIVVLVSTA